MGPRVTRVVWDRQGPTSVTDLGLAILEPPGDCIAYLNGEHSRWEGARGATGWLNTTKTPQYISSVRLKYSHLSP